MNGSTVVAYMNFITVDISNQFVAVGYNSAYYAIYATSSNGSTWTTPTYMNGVSVDGVMLSATISSAKKCVAVGFSVSGNYPVYAKSK
jgi:hypothetical protein